jgi:hypothetical protein
VYKINFLLLPVLYLKLSNEKAIGFYLVSMTLEF